MKEKPRRRATIYDIAEAAKTSSSTVSLVLGGSWRRYRIKAETADRVLAAAETLGYTINMRARGLRLKRSSLAGMIIPHYRNRFFAGLAEAFEAEARAQGLCPVVVSTQRDPAIERDVVETLLAQQVEFLFIAGVDGPDALNELCAEAGLPCVNIDLPGTKAPSVVSANRDGARMLTGALVDAVISAGGSAGDIRFVGGRLGEYATEERVAGFIEALEVRSVAVDPVRIARCGYRPAAARDVFETMIAADGRVPAGIFVNSITAFEGFASFLRAGNESRCHATQLGCFDWDPFAAALPVPVMMLRQNVEAMISEAFRLVTATAVSPAPLILVPPSFATVRGSGERGRKPPLSPERQTDICVSLDIRDRSPP